ncbi:HAND1 protein, partial [Penelope pileata]|nr:HAND1 protein [Penelope pileata]
MNLVGGYQHHHHHHPPMLHEPFLFGPAARCHPERAYFPGWVLNPAEVAPEIPGQSPGYGPAEFGAGGAGGLGALSGRLGRRKGVGGPKKERRRTESINSAFAELRECIPNVPADTKLSKIKTLRLATSYIAYLMEVLARDSPPGEPEGFKAELKKADGRENKRKRETPPEPYPQPPAPGEKRLKGRTGWPQQVWALEL